MLARNGIGAVNTVGFVDNFDAVCVAINELGAFCGKVALLGAVWFAIFIDFEFKDICDGFWPVLLDIAKLSFDGRHDIDLRDVLRDCGREFFYVDVLLAVDEEVAVIADKIVHPSVTKGAKAKIDAVKRRNTLFWIILLDVTNMSL